jgi:hypothetical protein
MKRIAWLSIGLGLGCMSPLSPADEVPEERDHHERFVGRWVVEQPTHALYEATYYTFEADGTLATGGSFPADCSGHLSKHCVTGSVANCVPDAGTPCESDLTCVFGSEWYSLDASTLIIEGDCSDGAAREIRIALASDTSSNTQWGGAGGTLVSVDGEVGWSHDNWDWVFRKCPAGTDESTCTPPSE